MNMNMNMVSKLFFILSINELMAGITLIAESRIYKKGSIFWN